MEEAVDVLDRLREIYETKLAKGPFPYADYCAARLSGREHGILVLHLADVAGIASHGRKLALITAERRVEFKKIVAQSFEERWPDTNAKITPERSPSLFRLMKDTDEARLIVMRYLAG